MKWETVTRDTAEENKFWFWRKYLLYSRWSTFPLQTGSSLHLLLRCILDFSFTFVAVCRHFLESEFCSLIHFFSPLSLQLRTILLRYSDDHHDGECTNKKEIDCVFSGICWPMNWAEKFQRGAVENCTEKCRGISWRRNKLNLMGSKNRRSGITFDTIGDDPRMSCHWTKLCQRETTAS